jgi:hypothetical protein
MATFVQRMKQNTPVEHSLPTGVVRIVKFSSINNDAFWPEI